ncbi:MAG TPA: alkaline phosphatase family protein [Longimicrobiaceae bacterium]
MALKIPGFGARRKRPRVAVIGLDCAEPSLVFDKLAGELPNLDRLRRRGLYGELESVIPAITVPAWSCMTSGKDPGALGVYGFRNRSDYSYDGLFVANSEAIREPRLWDILTREGLYSIVLGVPGTYPPRPVNGVTVSSFLAPSIEHEYTYPPELKEEIKAWVGTYMLDAEGFRTEEKAQLLERIYTMTQRRFEVARRLIRSRPWDLFMMVEMGVDRIHHGFWKAMDPLHRGHDPSSPFRDAIPDYYRYVDREIGTLLEALGPDTHVLVVSDHGARRMDGGICINEWLIREGYLVLAEEPDLSRGPVKFQQLKVDWSRTRAWAEGGYYGRVFLNVRDREPQGVVAPEEYELLRDELTRELEALGDENGNPIGTRCFRPQDLYDSAQGVPPDLLVYFGNLAWRSVGSVGWGTIHVFENDTGPDDANHAQQGILIYSDPGRNLGGKRLEGLHLLQVAPTVLRLLRREVPFDMQMEPIAEICEEAVAAR